MATRKIKDAQDLTTNELIYFKGHAKATYMSDGKTVEDAINQIGTGGDCQSPYVLPFDIETLDGLSYTDNIGSLQTDAYVFEKVKSALEVGRMIVIRYSSSDAGYHICDATYNGDAISVRVYNGLMLYSFEIYASSQGNILVEQYSLQSELVDGVNIATINGQSLTVGGDITIQGGSDVEVPTKVSQLENDAEYITQEDVAAVATSGSYNDLIDSPFIPNADSVKTWGFVKGVKLNGSTKTPSVSDGIVDLGTIEGGSTDGFVTKETIGALVVANAQALYDGNDVYALPSSANGDEDDVIVSKKTLKTINGQSLIGEGDITIGEGGGSSSGGGMNIVVMDDYVVDYAEPNTIYVITTNGLGGGLEVYEFIPPTNGYAEYVFIFQVGVMDSGFSIPEYVMWPNGQLPDVVRSGDVSYAEVYELNISASLVDGGEYIYKAVLTHFKEAQL